MRYFFLYMVFCVAGSFYCGDSFGQADPNFDNAAPSTVIPPSPAASALFNNINVPIDYYIGAQQTSIPLHTVKIGSLQMPISINYRATGIKVEEDAGWTGLEWDLVAGGAIGRSIVGKPDEKTLNDGAAGFRASATYFGMPDPTPDGATTAIWLGNLSTCNEYNLALGKNYELTPDNYFVHFCGQSAKLFFDKNSKPYFSPYKAWKLSGNETAGFTLIAEDGTIYLFNLPENSVNTSETLPSDDHTTPINGNTSWYLTQVISANGTDTINLTYKAVTYTPNSYNPMESYSIPISGQTAPYCGGTPSINSTKTYFTHLINGYILQSIITRNQRVDFMSNANRADMPTASAGLPYKLDSLLIFSTSPGMPDQMIKKYLFQYDYYNSTSTNAISKRLRLLSIVESDSVNDTGQTYQFTYNSNTLPDRNSMAQDYWGYYNGKNTNTTLIPSYTDSKGVTTVLADRSVNEAYAGMGLLQQIKYPTGGTTTFEYENNRYGVSDSVTIGVAAYAQTSDNGSTDQTPQTSTFSIPYDQFVTVVVIVDEGQALVGEAYCSLKQQGNSTPIVFGQDIGYTYYTQFLTAGVYTITATKTSTKAYGRMNVLYSIHAHNPQVGNSIGGARIRRMVQSDGTTSIVKKFLYLINDSVSSGHSMGSGVYSSYEYSPQICNYTKYGDWQYFTQHSVSTVDIGRTQGGDVGYSKVTILYGDNGENGSEDLYYNFIGDDGGGSHPYAPVASNDDLRGLLLQRVVFRNDHTILKRTTNTYNVNNQAGNPNFRQIFGCKAGVVRRGTTFDTNACPAGIGWSLDSKLYSIYQLWPTLASTTEETFSSATSDSVVASSWFNYDTTNLEISKKSFLTSKGDSVITYYKYPKDFGGTAVYDSMMGRNMIAQVIETDEYDNSNPIGRRQTNFALYNQPAKLLIAPANVKIQIGNGVLENRLQFNSYDVRGNLVSQNKANDVEHVYLYGYQGAYPIAEIINADSASVAYTSFEDGSTGSWIVSGGSLYITDAITGNKSYTSAGATFIKSGLNASRKYIVSYWTRGSAMTISGATAVSGLVKNGWTYYQHVLPAGSTSVTVTGSGAAIDELRLYPVDAMMTTYTYSPLVGIGSTCSPNNSITYYEYDGFERLLRVRDMDRNIVKQYDYQYQVPAIYYNDSMSRSFTRSCGAGGSASPITWQVAAGTYSSTISKADANQKALNYLLANGQQYATTNSNCSYPSAAYSQNYVRDNCATGGTPSTINYTVPAGKYISTTDTATANALAYADLIHNGPLHADSVGTCTFYNVFESGVFSKACGTGGVGSTDTTKVAAGTYSSTISQADANQQALNYIAANGQNNANSKGSCIYYNTMQTASFTRRNCACQYTGSSVPDTVKAGLYSSTVDLATANQLALAALNADGPGHANTYGTCTTTCYNVQGQKIINCSCQLGSQVCTSQTYNSSTKIYTITYHYLWSDGSISQNYVMTSQFPCAQGD